MNVVIPLARTPAVSVERFAHAPGVAHRDPELEHARSHSVSFVESGSFRLRVAGAWHEVTSAQVFAATPGLEFTCAHADESPQDRCLTVRYSETAVESLRSAGAVRAAWPLLGLSNRQAYLRLELQQEAADDARTETLAGALYWSLAAPGGPRARFRPGQVAWYAERLRRAKEMMATQYAEPLGLSCLAREVGMSLYHFARVFSELEGESPHRYLLGVRLACAAARLREGSSVTEACYAVGFGSLSHFTTTFRRRFGVRPSAFARAPAGR